MQLQTGTRLGPYEIVERVGGGGMGEVYRARDTRLNRSVAIKVLPSEYAADARLRARFEREARTISAISHPHICALHDVGRENGLDYLVMEYCEGQTLSERLERGQLPIEQVVEFGVEIAHALARAHHAGVVHRDLKPSNIMLTASGVKLLDFGLAKQHPFTAIAATTTSLHGPISEEGNLTGTLQYMAPEVLAGKDADVRSDIFALGAVLYEMVTGEQAFPGATKATAIASVLEHEPRGVRELRPEASASLERVILRCLAKDPEERAESAQDVAEELRWSTEPGSPSRAPLKRMPWILAGFTALVLIAVSIAIWNVRTRTALDTVVRLSIPLAPSEVIGLDGGQPNVAISRDGKRIAYAAVAGGLRRIYVRQLDSQEAMPVAGTERGAGPFFSPDGQTIGFFTIGNLYKVHVAGGMPQKLFSHVIGMGRGGTWSSDGSIYFCPGPSSGIWRIAAEGGKAERLTEPEAAAGENSHRWPELLPDGEHLLFTIRTDQITTFDNAKIAVLSLKTGKWKMILEGGSCARYVGDHIVFGRAGALYSAPFDLRSLSVTGPSRKVVDGIITIGGSGAAEYGVAENGDLAYLPGNAAHGATEFVTFDRHGHSNPLLTVNSGIDSFAMSPDERKLAMQIGGANDDIWLYDLSTGASTRFSFEPGDEVAPVWTPDGSRVIYASLAQKRLLIKRADGAGEPEELLPRLAGPMSCSPDGKILAINQNDDIWLLPITGKREPFPLLQTPFAENGARFSPDGKWIAYQSDETGVREVYVRGAKPGGGRWRLSTDGGQEPHWSADSTEVFYRTADSLLSVTLSVAGDDVRARKPRFLFPMPGSWDYDTTRDGFVIARSASVEQPVQQVNVVLNWKRELSP